MRPAASRPQGDGKELAKQKVVGGLLDVALDEIVRRAERARKRHNRALAGAASVFLLLAVAAGGSAVYALHQLRTNEAFLDATLKTATDLVNSAVAQANKYNVPRIATLALLATPRPTRCATVLSETTKPCRRSSGPSLPLPHIG
jgi:hypothetical protein